MRYFLNVARPQLVFPSSDVHDRYHEISKSLSFPDLISHVVPHIDFKVIDSHVRNNKRPVRIAFIGHPSLHKGWAEFVKLFKNEELGDSVQFFHFASKQSYIKYGLKFVEVDTVKSGQGAMVQAIKDCAIDFALIWPQWPETFGLTAIEALVGGCRIITNIGSGAIYSNLRNTDFMHAYSDFEEVEKFIIEYANAESAGLQYPASVNYEFSSLSAAVV
jgi:glycosyltransferase involved in cell wall biosynthesis